MKFFSFASECINIDSATISVLLDGTSVKTCGTISARYGLEMHDQTYVFSCDDTRANAVKVSIGAANSKFLTVSEILVYRTGYDIM